MHIAQFVHRYPPALGGAEAYTARLCEYLAARGDAITVWTTTAIDLEAFRQLGQRETDAGSEVVRLRGVSVRRYAPIRFPARRYILKAASLIPIRPLQCLTAPCNPICPAMWRDAGRFDGPLDAVHATAFPYSFPIACALRLGPATRRAVLPHAVPAPGRPRRPDATELAGNTPRRTCAGCCVRPTASSCRRAANATRWNRSAFTPTAIHLQGLGVDPAECTGGDREAARERMGRRPRRSGGRASRQQQRREGDSRFAPRRGARVGAGHAIPTSCSPGRRCRTSARSGRDLVPRTKSRGSAFSRTNRSETSSPASTLHALPSRTDSFGLVLLEAWANGKPNLVYRAGGPGELVRHGIDGLARSMRRCRGPRGRSLATNWSADADIAAFRWENAAATRISREFDWKDKLELVHRVLRGLSPRIAG